MKFRVVSDLSDDEFKYIVRSLINPDKIENIRRNFNEQNPFLSTISCDITTTWDDSTEDGIPITDEITLTYPYQSDGGLQTPFMRSPEDDERVRAFCFSRGIFPEHLLRRSWFPRTTVQKMEDDLLWGVEFDHSGDTQTIFGEKEDNN